MSDPIYRYCPMRATTLVEKEIAGHLLLICPTCQFSPFFGSRVVAVVVQYQGKLWLGRRTMEPGKDCWNVCGGFVELGETVEEAAIREVREEVNLDIELEKLIGIYSQGEASHVVGL